MKSKVCIMLTLVSLVVMCMGTFIQVSANYYSPVETLSITNFNTYANNATDDSTLKSGMTAKGWTLEPSDTVLTYRTDGGIGMGDGSSLRYLISNKGYGGSFNFVATVDSLWAGGGYVRICFNYADSNNYYYVKIATFGNNTNKISLCKKYNGADSVLAESDTYTAQMNSTFVANINYIRGAISAKIDLSTSSGVYKTASFNVSDSDLQYGKLGFCSENKSMIIKKLYVGSKTFLYEGDFSSSAVASDWLNIGSQLSAPIYDEATKTIQFPFGNGASYQNIVKDVNTTGSYNINTTIDSLALGRGEPRLMFNWQGDTSYYCVELFEKKIELNKYVNGTATLLSTLVSETEREQLNIISFVYSTINLNIAYNSNRTISVKIKVGNTLVCDKTVTDTTFSGGNIGFRISNSEVLKLRSFIVDSQSIITNDLIIEVDGVEKQDLVSAAGQNANIIIKNTKQETSPTYMVVVAIKDENGVLKAAGLMDTLDDIANMSLNIPEDVTASDSLYIYYWNQNMNPLCRVYKMH